MNQPTNPASAATRRAWDLIVQAGAALEDALQDTPVPGTPHDEMPVADQITHAAHVVTHLRTLADRTPVAWSIQVPAGDEMHVEVWGTLHDGITVPNGTVRETVAAWAEVIAAPVEEHRTASGGVELIAWGQVDGVPVQLSGHISSRAIAGGAR
ncbi:hypothetical protein ACOQFV_27490 [Nocardiopsis changdeensis]|uniref:Mycothiol-dependent maleylpyruvate isomerase metal-binding domain-containing protein n=1 Tax=Nocardiopsis changdeensis TaxID=2831969 RepID=A0ABX8BLA8_9ACTN|nr:MULTISPECIES: hypothetical protein [Nocardiopsis]QUX23010.1 hypothetical protein KGD84_00945 [Nocardiopsis changdeensis]QYX38955.1 hypothetical protein K1J57_10400 [Nocardiopsis sp. MT53]